MATVTRISVMPEKNAETRLKNPQV